MRLKHLPALTETLGHNFPLNGIYYDEALTNVLEEKKIRWNTETIFSIINAIGFWTTNAGKYPYIHTALHILKSLTTQFPDRNVWLGFRVYSDHNVNSGYILTNLKAWRNPKAWKYIHISNYVRQCMGKAVKSGKFAKFQRELRLKNLQPGIREHTWDSKNIYEWNRDLVFKLFIPILNLCPKSDKLLALINRSMRRICLKYTPRRHLRDAVYRYIHRTSEVGNN